MKKLVSKNNLHTLKSKYILKKYNKVIDKRQLDEDIILLLNKYISILNEIDLIYTNADIEFLKYGTTEYPDSLLENEIINRFCFFAIVLGFIDGNIEKINQNILLSKNNDYDTLLQYKESLIQFLNFREVVLLHFNESISCCDSKICIDTFNTNPCYKNFINCFLEISISNMSLKYQLELINAYVLGYKNCNKYTIYDIFDEYIKLFSELNIYKSNNKDKVKKVRLKLCK